MEKSTKKAYFLGVIWAGVVGTKYSIFYKKNNGSWVASYNNGFTRKNNVYYGSYAMHYANGTDKYGYKLNKNTNTKKSSSMNVDIFVE